MSSPALDVNNHIYMGARDNDTWAVDLAGNVLWRFSIPLDGDVMSSPVVDPDTGRIYTGCGCVGGGYVYALEPNAPTPKWQFKVGDSLHGSSPAIGSDGTIYVTSGPGRLHALTPGNAQATRKWPSVKIGKQTKYGGPSIGADDTIYVPTKTGLKAFNPTTGAQLWSVTTDGWINSTPGIAGADGAILYGTTTGCFYSINPNGTQKWKVCGLGGQFLSGTAIGANGFVYSATTTGKVYAFHPDNGAIRWQAQIGKVQWSAPAIAADGTLYIGSHDGKLYALEAD
jgi:outer membrane protein assembly factor BamB